MKKILFLVLLFSSVILFASNNKTSARINGVVYENVKGYKIPLSLASIQCKGTTIGTFSDKSGDFVLDLPEGNYKLTFSFAGYKPILKQLTIKKKKVLYLEITLDELSGFAGKE